MQRSVLSLRNLGLSLFFLLFIPPVFSETHTSITPVRESDSITYETAENEKFQVTYPSNVKVGKQFQVTIKVKGFSRLYEYFIDGERACDLLSRGGKDRSYVYPHTHQNTAPFRHASPDNSPPDSSEQYYVFEEVGVHTFGAKVLYCRNPEYALCGHGRLTSSITWQVTVAE